MKFYKDYLANGINLVRKCRCSRFPRFVFRGDKVRLECECGLHTDAVDVGEAGVTHIISDRVTSQKWLAVSDHRFLIEDWRDVVEEA